MRDQRRGSGIQDQPGGENDRTGCRVAPLQQEPGERRRDQDRSEPGLARAHPGGKPHREERIAGDQLGSSRERRAAAEGIPGPAPGHSEREHAECEPGRQNGEPQCARHAPILASLSRSDNRDGRRPPWAWRPAADAGHTVTGHQRAGSSKLPGRRRRHPVVRCPGQPTGQPHGSSAITRVPPPGGLSTASQPPSASTRSERPRSPELREGSAPPIPSSATTTVSRPFSCVMPDAHL